MRRNSLFVGANAGVGAIFSSLYIVVVPFLTSDQQGAHIHIFLLLITTGIKVKVN